MITDYTYIVCKTAGLTHLWRSKALTVPSREELTTTLPEALNVTPVTAEEWSVKVTKQKPEDMFQSLTYVCVCMSVCARVCMCVMLVNFQQ